MTASGSARRRRLSLPLNALVLGLVALVGVANAVPSEADDGYRKPQPPETFADQLWWFDAMRIGKAQRQVTGEGVTVAVIDDALDPSVPELRGQDVRLRESCRGHPLQPVKGSTVADHGTGMVSLIVGSGRGDMAGGRGVPGVAPGARVLFYSADRIPDTHALDCWDYEVDHVIDLAVEDGADIISMSVSLNKGPELIGSVRRALRAGVVVLGAAGNTTEGRPFHYPAWIQGVVGVGAADEYAQLWEDTPMDHHTAIAAPGVYVSTGQVLPDGEWTSNGAATGTSAPTAITAGALALVKSKYPEATGNQLIQHLIHSSKGGFTWYRGYGFGIVNVTTMLRSSPTQWPDENPLMGGPHHTLDTYPMWVSSRIDDPAGKGENAPASEERAETAAPGGSKADGSAGAAGPEGSRQAAGAVNRADDGVPVWVWPLVAVAVLAVAVGAVTMSRRRRHDAVAEANTQGV